MQVLLAHPGTQHAPRLACELEQRGFLGSYWTGLAFTESSLLATVARQVSGLSSLAGLATRIVPGVRPARLHTQPWTEIATLRRLRAGYDAPLTLHARNQRFQEKIPQRALLTSDAIIGFDTSSWILGERAQQLHRPFLLDRTIAHPTAYRRIMMELSRQYPAWVSTVTDRPSALVAAEAREHELATRIIVGGRFARDTLIAAGVPAQKISVNPYGVAWQDFTPIASKPTSTARPFRFLYVGSVIARKGVPVLLEAWRRLALRDAELWIAGSIGPHERTLLPELPGLKFLGQIPRAQLPALYAAADVFVLPSLFEGFGLVLLEALAAGLPIIATPHTGAVELLADPTLGEMVTPGSVDELAAALQRWHTSPGAHRAAVIQARAKLEQNFSWTAYGDRWATLLAEFS